MWTELITSCWRGEEVKSGAENTPQQGGKSFVGGRSARFECSVGSLSRTSLLKCPRKNPLPWEAEILDSFISALNRKGSGGSLALRSLSGAGGIY